MLSAKLVPKFMLVLIEKTRIFADILRIENVRNVGTRSRSFYSTPTPDSVFKKNEFSYYAYMYYFNKQTSKTSLL